MRSPARFAHRCDLVVERAPVAAEHMRAGDDDIDLARVIGAVFAKDGIDVKLAHTRQAALDACLSFRPQLIVLDLSLPDGDGFNDLMYATRAVNCSSPTSP